MKTIHCVLSLLLLVNIAYGQSNPVYSKLWGKNGEAWDKTRIPDFTEAGYKGGEQWPAYPVSVNIRRFGAKGDGSTDDTKAFRQAIAACKQQGALYIPAGTYLLTDSIIITKSRICLRGEGAGKTVLLFNKGLEQLYPLFGITNSHQTGWSWSGAMLLFSGTEQSGIEQLTVQFPDSTYDGHNFHERAYNAIGFSKNAHDGWIDHLQTINADIGIWIERSAHHITAQNWVLDFGPVRKAQKISGHHGVNIYGGHNLLQNFLVNGLYVHDLSVESEQSVFNVFRNGKGRDLCIDHHNHAQRNNLFTNLDMGEGTRLYVSGGNDTPRGVSFNETYWNLTARNDMDYCDHFNTDAMQSRNNVAVGIRTQKPSDTANSYGNWFETIDPGKLMPKDLYEAQRKLRRKK